MEQRLPMGSFRDRPTAEIERLEKTLGVLRLPKRNARRRLCSVPDRAPPPVAGSDRRRGGGCHGCVAVHAATARSRRRRVGNSGS